MIHKIRMPRVDANVQEATVSQWRVSPGRRVVAGDPLVEVITDKANFELEVEHDGILREQTASEKSVVPVGYVIALLSETPDEPLPDVAEENNRIMSQYQEALISGDFGALDVEAPTLEPEQQDAPPRADRVRATPAARRMAKKHELDLSAVAEHAQGVVKVEDVEAYLDREERR